MIWQSKRNHARTNQDGQVEAGSNQSHPNGWPPVDLPRHETASRFRDGLQDRCLLIDRYDVQ